MPLLKIAQTHKCLNQPSYRLYTFAEEQKKNWYKFWEEMDGDMDKILEFAKKADVDNPEDWYEELHKFLFDLFAGDVKLIKKAAKSDFKGFLGQVAENHVNNPKEKYWYYGKGLKPNDFIRVVEYAAQFEDPVRAISYINARTPEYGAKLYSEWLLSKVINKKELVTVASNMNKEAYKIEAAISGSIFDRLAVDDKIKHLRFANEEFKVLNVNKEDEFIVVEDENGKEGYVFDYWNVEV